MLQNRLSTKIGLFFAGLTALLALSACGGEQNVLTPTLGDDQPSPPPGSSLQASMQGVLVRADAPDTGIAGAQIALYPPSGAGAPLRTVFTRGDGSYEITSLAEGNYLLMIQFPDGTYQTIQVLVSVRRQNPVYSFCAIPAGREIREITIVPPAGDGAENAYLVGRQYSFRAILRDVSGQQITGWQPMWRVEGGVGTIDRFGRFTATSAGSGEIVAYLYSGNRLIQARVPIRVREMPGTQSNAWLLVPVKMVSGGYGLRAYDARSGKAVRDYPLGARSTPEGLSLSPEGIAYWHDRGARTVYRIDLQSGWISSFSVDRSTSGILALNGDEVLIIDDDGISSVVRLYNGRTGTPLNQWQQISLSECYGLALGQDGLIYISARYRDNRRFYYGILRYRLEDNQLVFDRIITQGSDLQRGIAFAANGDMIVCEGRVIQRYTSEGVRLGEGFSLPRNEIPYIIHFAWGILQPQDSVLFVQAKYGIWRLRYDGSRFALIPSDSNTHFLRGDYKGCLVWNR